MKNKILVHGGSRQHLNCSCLLACIVALWPTRTYCCTRNHIPVCALLLCAGPIAGCSAVLAVRIYCCGYRSLVCGFVVWAEASSKPKPKKGKKKQKKREKNSPGIDPDFFFDRRQLQADKGCGVGENNDVLRSRRGLQWVRLNLTRVRSELQILVKSQKQISFVQIERGLLCGECAPRLICLLSCDSAVRFSESDNSRQRRILPCLAPRRVHFAPPWIQASEPALTDSSLAPKRRAEALHVVFFPTKHPSPCCCA